MRRNFANSSNINSNPELREIIRIYGPEYRSTLENKEELSFVNSQQVFNDLAMELIQEGDQLDTDRLMIRFPEFARNSRLLRGFKQKRLKSFKDIISFVQDPISRAYNKVELEQYLRSMVPLNVVRQLRDLNINPPKNEQLIYPNFASQLYNYINK